MWLGFMLAALTFVYKDEHPGRFVGSLALLTAVHAYGVVLCAGICLAWLWDIRKEYGSLRAMVAGCVKDKRFWWLGGLLVLALGVIAVIWPRPDTFAINFTSHKAPLWNRLVYAFFMLPADAFFSDAWGIKTHSVENYFRWEVMAPTVFIGLIVWVCVGVLVPKKHLKYIGLPAVLFFLMVSLCYAFHHHIGIFVLLVLFISWISLDCPGKSKWDDWATRLSQETQTVLKKTFFSILVIAVVTGLTWTAADMAVDIREPFAAARASAKFIRQHRLDRAPIFAAWTLIAQTDGQFFQEIFHVSGTTLTAYFDRNILSNLNDGVDHLAYSSHRWPKQEEIDTYFAKWRDEGLPEVLFGREGFSFVFPEIDFFKEYAPVYKVEDVVLWKFYLAPWRSVTYIYVRRDVLDKYSVQEVTDESVDSRIGNILVKDEITE